MRRGWTLHTMHGLNPGATDVKDFTTTHWVEIYHQPTLRYLIARVYGWYVDHVVKIPGMTWIDKHTGRATDDEIGMPWFAKQDCRCYVLSQRGRVSFGSFEIDEPTYALMTERNPEP